jgi:hypothetical protein
VDASTRPVAEFWDWFARNAEHIRAAGPDGLAQGVTEELGGRLKRCHPGLTWEITPTDPDRWVLCVSADGNPDVFPAVTAVVGAAPVLPGWSISAFRQRGPLDVRLEFGGHTLTYDDVWFTAEPRGGSLSLTLWIRGLTAENDPLLSQGALILLDNAIGEYDAGTRIAELNRGPLPDDPDMKPGLHPLRQLPEMVDFLKRR